MSPVGAPTPVRELVFSVRGLAEAVWRRGDIHARYDLNTRPEEGVAVQRRLQAERGGTYKRELAVGSRWEEEGVALVLAGRVDGCDLDAPIPVVEEFKTTRMDAVALHAHLGSVHVAQARLYAALLAEASTAAEWLVRVIYAHPDSLAVHVVEERMRRDELRAFYVDTCRRLGHEARMLMSHRDARNERLRVLEFPYAAFRSSQHVLARGVYRALRDGAGLLASAPTGTGKTMGTLYPALKAAAEDRFDRVVYTTARGTGQRVALDAIRRIAERVPLRAVTIAAKASVCFKDRPDCDPLTCEFARGYYDRVHGAMAELRATRDASIERIAEVARRHLVCPFELSLDAAVMSDVVICDYNYVFDPVVRLKRVHGFVGDRTALLIDEAHQLAPRVRRSLSCRIARSVVRDARGKLAHPDLAASRSSLERAFVALRRSASAGRDLDRHAAVEVEVDEPAVLLRSARRLLERWLEAPRVAAPSAEAEALLFDLLRLVRAADWCEPDRFIWVLRLHGKEIEIVLECLDPSGHIATTLETFAGNVRFSATLAPLELAQRQHGDSDGRTLSVPSPFPAEHLGVFIVPDVPVLYRERTAGVEALVAVIERVYTARAGTYLIAFPSFEYLRMVAERLVPRPDVEVLRQRPDMGADERARFVAALADRDAGRLVMVVLGGVFAESIDLPDGALAGIVVVGCGLAPPSGELDRIARRFDDDGFEVAYRQPAMTRVVQAAGRLIRSEHDRGVLCLVDPRYRGSPFQRYFPAHWRPETVQARRIGSRLSEFWSSR